MKSQDLNTTIKIDGKDVTVTNMRRVTEGSLAQASLRSHDDSPASA